MIWLFLSVSLVVLVYLAIQFPAIRKAIKVCLIVLFFVVAGGLAWLFYLNVEEHNRAELSRRLIRLDEILFTDIRKLEGQRQCN
jgi:hypothetical protein